MRGIVVVAGVVVVGLAACTATVSVETDAGGGTDAAAGAADSTAPSVDAGGSRDAVTDRVVFDAEATDGSERDGSERDGADPDGGARDAADAEALDGGAVDAGSDASPDGGAPVVIVDGSTYPVSGFDLDGTTLVYRDARGFHACPIDGCAAPSASYTSLALASPVRFTMSGGRLYWVSLGAPATTREIRSLDAPTLTGQRKENVLFCTSVSYLRAEATAAIAVYNASSSSTGSNPQTYTLTRTPNTARTGVAAEGHCVATGCETSTHRWAIVGGSIVRTPK